MVKQYSMENVTIIISMVIEQLNAQINLSLKESVTIATNKDTNLQSVRLRSRTQQRKNLKQCLDGITTQGLDVTTMVILGTLEKTV